MCLIHSIDSDQWLTVKGTRDENYTDFQSKNRDFLDLNFLYGFYIITVGRGHEFDLLIKHQVHRTISHRVMSSGSLKNGHLGSIPNPYHLWSVKSNILDEKSRFNILKMMVSASYFQNRRRRCVDHVGKVWRPYDHSKWCFESRNCQKYDFFVVFPFTPQ